MTPAPSKPRGFLYTLDDLKSKREWVPDGARQHCSSCTKKFFLGGGKHHCRRCGDVVCKACAPYAGAMLPVVGRTKIRVCHTCRFQDEARPESHFLADLSSSEDDEEVEEALLLKTEMLLFSPSREVMRRMEEKLSKQKLVECEDRPTTASSTASRASTSA